MKIVYEREMQKTTKKINKDRRVHWRTEAIVKGSELNDFVVHLS